MDNLFIEQLVIGTIMIVLTVFLHAVVLDRLIILLEHSGPYFFKLFRKLWRSSLLIMTVLGIFISHVVQIWGWAGLYLALDALPDLEESLYFSTSTYTTVGYGDVVVGKDWRLLSSFQSANGFILFGWSTAFIFEIMSKLYDKDQIKRIKSR